MPKTVLRGLFIVLTLQELHYKISSENWETFNCFYRSGALSEDYERKKQAMLKAEEDTTFSLHKKKVSRC